MSLLLPAVYCLVVEEGWEWMREWINSWLVRNHWDVAVTQSVWQWLDWMDVHHQFMLSSLILASSIHLLSTLILILGTMILKRSLLLPWIITDLIIIIIMVFLFISWTFLSFFVDLLIAIVFPVMAGLLLGLWIVLWRNTVRLYSRGLEPAPPPKPQIVTKAGYKTVPVDPSRQAARQQAHKLQHIS